MPLSSANARNGDPSRARTTVAPVVESGSGKGNSWSSKNMDAHETRAETINRLAALGTLQAFASFAVLALVASATPSCFDALFIFSPPLQGEGWVGMVLLDLSGTFESIQALPRCSRILRCSSSARP